MFESVDATRNVKPSVSIKGQIGLSTAIRELDGRNFLSLTKALAHIVDDKAYNIFSHHEKKLRYSFEDWALPNWSICGKKDKKEDENVVASKIFAWYLLSIKSLSQFENHVKKDLSSDVFNKPCQQETNKEQKQMEDWSWNCWSCHWFN